MGRGEAKRELPDCISLTETGRCRQLETKQCAGKKCPFMKTRLTCQEQETKVYQRLTSLDEEMQERISVKYYHGTRPWQSRQGGGERGRKRRSGQKAE